MRGSPGRTLAATRSRLSHARYSIADGLRGIGGALVRIPRALANGVRGFWSGLGRETRRRLAVALAFLVALGLFFGFAVPNLPCQVPGGDSCPPPDDAEEIVPSDSLAYVHANLDPETEQYEEAREVSRSLPTITEQITSRALALLPGPEGGPPSFEREIEPWFGGEAALIAIPGRGERALVVANLLEVADQQGAAEFAEGVAGRKPRKQDHEGIEVTVNDAGLASAQVEGFLALGAEAGVRSVIDTATGVEGSPALTENESADEVREELPDHRLVEAYVSSDGAGELLRGATGILGSLEPFVSPQSTRGAAAALAAGDGELELAVRSVLDADRARARPGFFAAFAPFEAELPERLGSDSLAYLGLGDPERTVQALLKQASAERPGIATGFKDLAQELRRDGKVDLEKELLPALGDEAAFALAPRPEADPQADEGEATIPPPPGEGPAAPPPVDESTPYLEFVARDVDEARARRALAQLQGPVANGIEPQAGLQPGRFEELEVGGVEARSLQVSPIVELTYAVFEGLAAVATSPAAIEQLADGDGGLDGAELFERATDDFDDELSLLGFFDLGELILVGEQLGLAENPVYAAFAPEIRSLSALGVTVRAGEDSVAADARLLVEPPDETSSPGEQATPEPEAPAP